ncbi:hypothetical protein ACGFSI_01345 [Streptomyces virginiae]|uniref:hypothetical protein n=1 Tax=Streptomyces virginiae TaxID=1961 RepID=UPI00371A6D4B
MRRLETGDPLASPSARRPFVAVPEVVQLAGRTDGRPGVTYVEACARWRMPYPYGMT